MRLVSKSLATRFRISTDSLTRGAARDGSAATASLSTTFTMPATAPASFD